MPAPAVAVPAEADYVRHMRTGMAEVATRVALLVTIGAVTPWVSAAATGRPARTLDDARPAFEELLEGSDGGVPRKLLDDCRCVAVFPGVVKGALGIGGRMGRGAISCRDRAGGWSPPSFMTLTGGGFGFQIGVQKADIVLFIMSERGARSFLESEFSLGAEGAVAVGPIGRNVEAGTDVKLDAAIYSYARAKGLFAGVSLEGARVNSDRKAIRSYYGEDLDPLAIVFDHAVEKVPAGAERFRAALSKASRVKTGEKSKPPAPGEDRNRSGP